MNENEIEKRLRQFESVCRERRLPLTVQRQEVLKAVLESRDHPTADQVYAALSGSIPGLSRTTVYRVLNTLVEMGAIRRLHHPGATARFDGKIRRHHHLVCMKCDKVIDVDDPSLDAVPMPDIPKHEFEIDDFSVHFSGLCAECRRKTQ